MPIFRLKSCASSKLIRTWTNGWAHTREDGDLRYHRAHYDVTVITNWYESIHNVVFLRSHRQWWYCWSWISLLEYKAWTNKTFDRIKSRNQIMHMNMMHRINIKLQQLLCSNYLKLIKHVDIIYHFSILLFRGQSTFILYFHRRQRIDYSPHDDVVKWKKIKRYWPFVRETHRSPVNSPHKGQWHGALIFSLICPLNTRLSKQSWGWWFETPSPSLWRHCNDSQYYGCDASSQDINSQGVDLVWPEYSVFSTRGLKIFHDIYLPWLCEEV